MTIEFNGKKYEVVKTHQPNICNLCDAEPDCVVLKALKPNKNLPCHGLMFNEYLKEIKEVEK